MNDNKLIAEFMGMKYSDERSFDNGEWTHTIKSLSKFQTDWNWLMPVVEKIESLRDTNGDGYRYTSDMCNTHIEGSKIGVIGASYKIDAVYQSVIEFINLKTNNEELNCEFCGKEMKEEDHNFCDICDECRQEV